MIANRLLPLHNNKLALGTFRLAALFARGKVPLLPHLLYLLNAIIWGCELHYCAKVGRRFRLAHSQGVVVGSECVLGDDVKLYSGVVLGRRKPGDGMPRLGNRVIVGSGAKVLGDIEIGDGSIIGANAVVMTSLPEGSKVTPCTFVGQLGEPD